MSFLFLVREDAVCILQSGGADPTTGGGPHGGFNCREIARPFSQGKKKRREMEVTVFLSP